MNYVFMPDDLSEQQRLAELKVAANENGISFVCNTSFHQKNETQARAMASLAKKYSDFALPHSTFADGVCQMGAGSSITIAANGDIYRCPYMLKGSGGNIMLLREESLCAVFSRYLGERRYACVIRKTGAGDP
jgi:hypothetical protein